MKINFSKEKTTYYWIIIILLANYFLSQEANLLFLLLTFLYLTLINKNSFNLNFPGKTIYFYLLFSGIIIGLFNLTTGNHSLYSGIKQLYLFALIFLYWSIGTMIVKKKTISRKTILRAMMCASIIYCCYDLYIAITQLFIGNFTSLYYYRNMIGGGSFLAVISIYLILFYNKELAYKKSVVFFISIISIISFTIHFSRTYLIELMLLIAFSGIKLNISKLRKFFLIFSICALVSFIVFPNMMNSYIEKIFNSIQELNFNRSTWTEYSIIQDWRGYEAYCELYHFKFADLFEKFFGGGFGATLDVLGYAHLVTNENTLVMLHNGYFTQLMLWGINGIFCLILWWIQLFKFASKLDNYQDRSFIRGMVIVMAVITYFLMGPFFGKSIAIYIFYIALFYMMSKKGVIK